MQDSKAVRRFHDRTRFKPHLATPRHEALKHLPYAFASCDWLAINDENGIALVERGHSVYIGEVEGIPEEGVDFGWLYAGITFSSTARIAG